MRLSRAPWPAQVARLRCWASCGLMPPGPLPLPADRTHVLDLGSNATVGDVMAAIEARQGESRRAGQGAGASKAAAPVLSFTPVP